MMQKKMMQVLLSACLVCGLLLMGSATTLAEESSDSPSFVAKLKEMEDRTMMLHMVMKQLTHTYKKAKEDHQFMQDNGMDEKDIVRLERAFQKKIKKMIDAAVSDINDI